MPPIDPSQFIRTLNLRMIWSAGSNGSPDEIKRVCDALNANRVQIEREAEDCIDHGLRGVGFEDTNTRVRIASIVDSLQIELSIQVTFASLVQETSEHVYKVAHKVDECAGSVLRGRVSRQDVRVVEQGRRMLLERSVPKQVQAQPVLAQAVKPAASGLLEVQKKVQQLARWIAINLLISLLALFAIFVLIVRLSQR